MIHQIGNEMRPRNAGKILLSGPIAGFMPGSFQAAYNGTKSFIDSFAFALRNELREADIVVSCLMPGPTETEFFRRADMLDTAVGQQDKDDPAMVAKTGFEALMRGEAESSAAGGTRSRRRSPISRPRVSWPSSIAKWPNRRRRLIDGRLVTRRNRVL